MAFDFPSSPTNGQVYTSGGASYVYNGYGWDVQATLNPANYVLKAGDTMSGPLTSTGNIQALNLTALGGAVYSALTSTVGTYYFGSGTSKYLTYDGTNFTINGGTLNVNGDLTISKTSPQIILGMSASGQIARLISYNGAYPRWLFELGDASAESGSNAGSNLRIVNFNDAGVQIGTPVYIYRSTSGVTLGGDLSINKASPSLWLMKTAAAQHPQIIGAVGTSVRWMMSVGDASAESGGNAGSNFTIHRYGDNGAYINPAFTIIRSTGNVIANGNLSAFALTASGGDIYAARTSTSGTYYFGADASRYLTYDGNAFVLSGGSQLQINSAAIIVNDPAGSRSVMYHQCASSNAWAHLGDANGPYFLLNSNWSSGVYLPSQSSTAWAAYSSMLIKENVEELNVLGSIDQYRAIRYTNKMTGVIEIGVVADELHPLYPELVVLGEPSDDKSVPKSLPDARLSSVTYDRLGPIALQGVKELLKRVEALEAKLQEKRNGT